MTHLQTPITRSPGWARPSRRRVVRAICGQLAAAVAVALPAAAQHADTVHLAALQAAALTRDPRAEQTRLLTEQTALRLDNLRAERLPSLALGGQAQHQSAVTSVNFPGAVTPFKDTYDAHLATRVRLLDPSLAPRRAVERATLADAEARVRSTLHAQRQVVNDAFFTALLLEGQRDVLQAAIAELETQLRLARDRVSAGAALPSDAAMLEAEVLRRQQSLDEARSTRAVALALLGDLTGRPFSGDEVLALPTFGAGAEVNTVAIDSLRTRPEYAQFASGRDLVEARRGAVASQEKPRLSAFGRTGYGRPGLNQLSRDFDEYWLAGVQLEWSPFTWGLARREREALALQQRVLDTEEQAFTDRLRRGSLADQAAIERLGRTLVTDDAIVALRERVLTETRLRHGEGVVTAAEFVDRESELTTARLMRHTHRVELAQTRARLLTTVGLEVR